MRIEKQKICDLPMVYVTAELFLSGRRFLAAASEAPGEHAYIIDPVKGEYADLWQGDTGVMNVIQIPGEERLLAITKFYPVFQSREAAVCMLTPGKGGYMAPWHIEEVLPLPFCHRIGIVESNNGLFLLGCQLCRDKDYQEDWTQPGALWVSPIPKRGKPGWHWSKLFDGLTKNHGLFIDGGHQVYVCAENGVMLFDMGDYQEGEPMMPRLVSTAPTSDLYIHHDGKRIIVGTIEPFHGNTLSVYHLTPSSYELLAQFDIAFGHAVWIGTLFGRRAAIVGNRGGEKKQLEIIYWESGERAVLEEGVGPTQITVYQDGDTVRLLAANHGSGEVTLYTMHNE